MKHSSKLAKIIELLKSTLDLLQDYVIEQGLKEIDLERYQELKPLIYKFIKSMKPDDVIPPTDDTAEQTGIILIPPVTPKEAKKRVRHIKKVATDTNIGTVIDQDT